MWQVLFFVNPATVTLALVGLLIAAGVASKLFQNGNFRRPHARVALSILSVVYFSVLLIGFEPLMEEAEGESDTPEIHWNPLYFIQDLKEQSNTIESFGQTLPEGEIAFYSQERIDAANPPPEAQGVDYLVHGGAQQLVIRDQEGREVSTPEKHSVERHMTEAIERNEGTNEHAALIIEEKVVNLLLFVPIGIVAVFCFSNVFIRLLYGPLLSFTIEGTQWFAAGGNIVDSSDLAANSLGAPLGVSFASASTFFLNRMGYRENIAHE